MNDDGRAGGFAVLVVCEGNICRSPVAQALLGRALDDAGVQVTSAGLRARAGSPVETRMAQLLGDAAPQHFAAQQVTTAMLDAADLVLAMTRDQRSTLVRLSPGCLRRAFTLREFAELVVLVRRDRPLDVQTPVQALAEFTVLAPRYRDRRSGGPEGDDVEDPFGRAPVEYERAFRSIDAAVHDLATAVVGPDRVARDRAGAAG